MEKVAVFCGDGLGDSLIMMIASHAYQKLGYPVTTFTNSLSSFGTWFEGFEFVEKPLLPFCEKMLQPFDWVLLHHENSPRARAIFSLREKPSFPRVISFYNNYRFSKHAPLTPGLDFAFDESKPMVENLSFSLQKLLHLPEPPLDIGLKVPKGLIHRKEKQRVVIHPTSSLSRKNWLPSKFIGLGKRLFKEGFSPYLCVTEQEREPFLPALEFGIQVPKLTHLSELAELLFESGYFIGNDSGPGHLASYLQIPSLILTPFKTSIRHWQPGWKKASILFPPSWIPNFKKLRWKEKYWAHFLSVGRVFQAFEKILE